MTAKTNIKKKKENKFKDVYLKITIRKICLFVVRLLFLTIYRIRVVGLENIPKTKCIVCANHKSTFDAVFLMGVFPKNIHFMSKQSIWTHWWGKFIGFAFDMIPAKRDGKDILAIKEAYKVLNNDEILGIFPEGTRNGVSKEIPVKSGATFISIKKDAPILPIAISGKLKPFTKNTVTIGKPIDLKKMLEDGKTEKDTEELKRLTNIVMQEIFKLSIDGQYDEYLNRDIKIH